MGIKVSAVVFVSAFLGDAYDLVEVLDGDGAGGVAPYFEQGVDEDDPEVVAAVSDEGLVALDK